VKRRLSEFGFMFGPIEVTRTMVLPGDRYVITVKTEKGGSIDIYASATGRSLRAFRNGRGEMLPQTPQTREVSR